MSDPRLVEANGLGIIDKDTTSEPSSITAGQDTSSSFLLDFIEAFTSNLGSRVFDDCFVSWKPSFIPYHSEFKLIFTGLNRGCFYHVSNQKLNNITPFDYAPRLHSDIRKRLIEEIIKTKSILEQTNKIMGTNYTEPWWIPIIDKTRRDNTFQITNEIVNQHNSIEDLDVKTAENIANDINSGKYQGSYLQFLTTIEGDDTHDTAETGFILNTGPTSESQAGATTDSTLVAPMQVSISDSVSQAQPKTKSNSTSTTPNTSLVSIAPVQVSSIPGPTAESQAGATTDSTLVAPMQVSISDSVSQAQPKTKSNSTSTTPNTSMVSTAPVQVSSIPGPTAESQAGATTDSTLIAPIQVSISDSVSQAQSKTKSSFTPITPLISTAPVQAIQVSIPDSVSKAQPKAKSSSTSITPITPLLSTAPVQAIQVSIPDSVSKAQSKAKSSSTSITPITPLLSTAPVQAIQVSISDSVSKAQSKAKSSSTSITPIIPLISTAPVQAKQVSTSDSVSKAQPKAKAKSSSTSITPITPLLSTAPVQAKQVSTSDSVSKAQPKAKAKSSSTSTTPITPVQAMQVSTSDSVSKAQPIAKVKASSTSTTPITPLILPAPVQAMQVSIPDPISQAQPAVDKESPRSAPAQEAAPALQERKTRETKDCAHSSTTSCLLQFAAEEHTEGFPSDEEILSMEVAADQVLSAHPLLLGVPPTPGSGAMGLKWAYATHTAADYALQKAGFWLFEKPTTYFCYQKYAYVRSGLGVEQAPIVVDTNGERLLEPDIDFNGQSLIINAHNQPWPDIRSNPRHPDFVPAPRLVEYQACEVAGLSVWRHDRNLLDCRLPGCDKKISDWNPRTIICLTCGPKSFIRYCSIEHQDADLKEHWRECGRHELIMKRVVDDGSAPHRFGRLAPALRDMRHATNFPKYRQITFAARNYGRYTLFDWKSGEPTTLAWDDRYPRKREMEARIEQLLNVSLLDSNNTILVGLLYRTLRELLVLKGTWTMGTTFALAKQFVEEFGLNVWTMDKSRLCECEWTGKNLDDGLHILGCQRLYRLYPMEYQISGMKGFVEMMEARFWILRAWRQQHPTVSHWTDRSAGDGFDGEIDGDGPLLGEGWEGWGAFADDITA